MVKFLPRVNCGRGCQELPQSVGGLGRGLRPWRYLGLALSESVGANGIDARRLHGAPYNLTGGKNRH